MLTRRHVLAGAAATAAVAAMPAAAAIAEVEVAPASWVMTFPDWEPGIAYTVGSIVRIGRTACYCMRPHLSGEEPNYGPDRIQHVDDITDWVTA